MSTAARSAPAATPLVVGGAVSLLGLVAGLATYKFAVFGMKWIAVGLVLVALPCFVIVMGSLRDSLMAMLVASLSISLDINPWWNDNYITIRKGIPIGMTFLVLTAAIGLLWWGAITRRSRLRYYPSVLVPMLLVVLWAALSSIKAVTPTDVLYNLPMVVTCALIFFYAANFLVRAADTRLIVLWVAITVAVSSTLGLLEYLTGGAVNLTFLGGRESVLVKAYGNVSLSRVSGTLRHANTLSFYLNGFLPLLAAYAVAARDLRVRLLCFAALGLGFVTQILTFSRAGWIAFFLSAMIIFGYFCTRRARVEFPRVWMRFVGAGSLAVLLAIPLLPQIALRLTEPDAGASASRIPLIKTALKIIAANPVLGIGLGNYKQTVTRYDFNPSSTGGTSRVGGPTPNHVHNMYLLTAAEIGLPVLVMLLWMCGVFTYHAFRCAFFASREPALFAVGVCSGLMGMLAHGMVEPGNFSMLKYAWIMFLGGLLVALDDLRRSESRRRGVTAAVARGDDFGFTAPPPTRYRAHRAEWV